MWLVRKKKHSNKISDCGLVLGPKKSLGYCESSLKKKNIDSILQLNIITEIYLVQSQCLMKFQVQILLNLCIFFLTF